MTQERISLQKVKADLKQLLNKKISRAWKGYGSALFLEIGELHNELGWTKNGKPKVSAAGEWTLSSEGSWRLLGKDKQQVIQAEKTSGEQLNDIVKTLEGLSIKEIHLTESLVLTFSNNQLIVFDKADYGFFTLLYNEKRAITYEKSYPYLQHIAL